MLWDYFIIAFRSLIHRKVRSWLTMIGIVIGIAAVVSLISLGEGLREAITGQFSDIGTDRFIVQPAGAGFGPPGSLAIEKLTEKDLRAVRQVNGVKVAATRFLKTTAVEFEDDQEFLFITSLPEEADERRLVIDSVGLEIAQGRMLKPGDSNKVVVGDSFASRFVFEENVQVGNRLLINQTAFEIIGIMERRGSVTGDEVIIMNEDKFKDIFNIGEKIDFIAVQVAAGESP